VRLLIRECTRTPLISRVSVYLSISPVVSRHRLGKHVSAATDTRNEGELFDALFSWGPCSIKGEYIGMSQLLDSAVGLVLIMDSGSVMQEPY
jgi:hypothetical protein